MKKILLFCLFLIFIPYFVISFFLHIYYEEFSYSGDLIIRVMQKNGQIKRVELENYVVGVVAGEMPLSFDDEALKAQSVAARTYALKKMISNKNNDYDVVDTTANQVYLDDEYLINVWGNNYDNYISRLRSIVESTSGLIITYNGDIIDALYFSTSSGFTENAVNVFGNNVPYLTSVDSSWDSISPSFSDIKVFSKNDFYKRLNIPYSDNLVFNILDKTQTGRVNKLSINGNVFDSKTIVSNLMLKSSWFDIYCDKSNVFVKTRGYGHGVGMSQYGAEAMAQKGYKFDEIIKYYYKDVKISKL